MNEPLLEVRDLVVEYPAWRGRLRAVDGVSFRLDAARTVGIVGESGCGKSSLVRAILQLEKYRGSVRLRGDDLGALSRGALRRARRHMQAVFQDPLASLDPGMRVASLIEEPLRVHARELRRPARMAKVLEVLKRVGLDAELAERHPHELSGGQCQRVGIARAIVCEPALLVCDEPVSALDTSIRGQILGLLATLRQELGIGIVFIAHDMTAVRYLCDDVLVMREGKVVEAGPRDAVFESPQHPYTRELIDAVLPPDVKADLSGEKVAG